MPNARFEYLYRDASNYKAWGSVVFAGKTTDDLTRGLLRALESSEFFIAHQVRIPELFTDLQSWPLEQDDHCWHEFSCIESTSEAANDRYGRSIEEFIAEVEQQSALGWQIFDPMDELSRRSPSLG
jgi:hypothetical protein